MNKQKQFRVIKRRTDAWQKKNPIMFKIQYIAIILSMIVEEVRGVWGKKKRCAAKLNFHYFNKCHYELNSNFNIIIDILPGSCFYYGIKSTNFT